MALIHVIIRCPQIFFDIPTSLLGVSLSTPWSDHKFRHLAQYAVKKRDIMLNC